MKTQASDASLGVETEPSGADLAPPLMFSADYRIVAIAIRLQRVLTKFHCPLNNSFSVCMEDSQLTLNVH